MEPLHNRSTSISELVEAEAKDAGARARLYELLHFGRHPACRIGKRLSEVIQTLDRCSVIDALEESWPTGQGLWEDKLDVLLKGRRVAYRRGKGYAAYAIDVVSRMAGMTSPQVYAPDVTDLGEFLHGRITKLLDTTNHLPPEARMCLLAAKMQLAQGEPTSLEIDACRLRKVAEASGLPSFYFFQYDEECAAYESFVREALVVLEAIISYHLAGESLRAFRGYIAKHYSRFLRNVEGQSADAYIDMLYDKLRQQVLDGNTYFLNYRIPLRNCLYQVLGSVLRDHARKQASGRMIRGAPFSQIGENRVRQLEAKVDHVPFDAEHVRETLTSALSVVTCTEDGQALRDALISVPLAGKCASAIDISKAKRALILWAPQITGVAVDHIAELPDTYQALFRDYATSEWAETIRTLIDCDRIACMQHRTRDWLATKLGVSKHTLGKWIRCESFPRKEQIDHLRQAIRSPERIAGDFR